MVVTTDESQREDATWHEVLAEAQPGDAIEEKRALRDVQSRLFGQAAGPIMLSRYIVLRRLGSGGLGVVYAAYDPELDRKVAIKLLRARRGREQDRALIEEARTLARFTHPNVVTVHDVGVYDRPTAALPEIDRAGVFLVMELIDGIDLETWCRHSDRSVAEILAAFVAAGRGLAAAHSAGLVHRDFKPANVLVDAAGGVRVVDFGLARAEAHPSDGSDPPPPSDGTASTTGAGTPAYMAPEQHRGTTVDGRADQFAYCVTLYEALFQRRPFTSGTVTALEVEKRSGMPTGHTPHHPVPRRLLAALRRGMSPDPSDRFASMDELLALIDRRRDAQRIFIAIGLVVVSALTVASWMNRSESSCDDTGALRERVWGPSLRAELSQRFAASSLPYGERAWATVDEQVQAYLVQWSQARRDTCERARDGVVTVAAGNAEQHCLDRAPEAVESLAEVLATATATDIENSVALAERLPSLAECKGANAALADDDLRRALSRVTALHAVARYDEARAQAQALAETASTAGRRDVESRARLWLGRTLATKGDGPGARQQLFAALALAERLDDAPAVYEATVELASVALDESRPDEAHGWLDLAQARAERLAMSEALRFRELVQRARLAYERGDDVAGIELGTRLVERSAALFGERNTQVGLAFSLRARARSRRGDRVGASEDFARALELYRELLGEQHPATAQAWENVGSMLMEAGELDDALAAYDRARAALLLNYAASHPRLAMLDSNRANALAAAGRLHEAAALATDALSRLRAARPDDHVTLGIGLTIVSGLLSDTDDLQGGVAAAEEAFELLRNSAGPDHPNTLTAEAARARAWKTVGRLDEAHESLVSVRARIVEQVGPDDPNLVPVDMLLAELSAARHHDGPHATAAPP